MGEHFFCSEAESEIVCKQLFRGEREEKLRCNQSIEVHIYSISHNV